MDNPVSEPKWYNKAWLVGLLFVIFFPIGLYGLWKSDSISMVWKIGVTTIFTLMVIANLPFDNVSNPYQNNDLILIDSSASLVLKYDFENAKTVLDSVRDTTLFKVRDSLLLAIDKKQRLITRVLGTYSYVDKSGVEVVIKLGFNDSTHVFYSKLQGFAIGQPINGVKSSGQFKLIDDEGTLDVDWEVPGFNKAMSAISISEKSNKTQLILQNGTVYRKVSTDYKSIIKPTVKVNTERREQAKTVCGNEWTRLSQVEDLLPYEWEISVSTHIRESYREFIDDAEVVGARSNGIIIEATGNITGNTYRVIWLCNGSIIAY